MNDTTGAHAVKFLDPRTPALPLDAARRAAAEVFGLEGDFKALVSERDQNFRVTDAAGRQVVLKISNLGEDPAVVDLQTQALRHIESADPELAVPRVVPTREGAATGWIEGDGGGRHILRALTYVPGLDLGSVAPTPALLRDLGGALARLGKALRGFTHRAARHELLWDLRQIAGLRGHSGHIAEPAARAAVETVIDRFVQDILPGLAKLRSQVIHNDANGNNVVIDPAAPGRIAGFIDFGDMIHSVLAADLAVTAADLCAADDVLETMSALVAGYDAVVPLEAEEIDLLYDLVLARYALTAVILAWRDDSPDGTGYLAPYLPTALAGVERLSTLGREAVRAQLRRACRYPPYCPPAGGAGTHQESETAVLVERRHRLLGATLELSYDRPVHLVRGEGAWLFDADGRRFLDAYNNVPQVGHAHPQVVRAISRQAAALNTNTRYLFGVILDYAERLTSTLPEGLDCCLFVNSGSEANDAAWRMAKQATGQAGALVMEHAYHGISEAIAALSPEIPSARLADHVRTLLCPDPYRGPYKAGDPDIAGRYAADAGRALAELDAAGVRPAALMVDTGFASNGAPDVPAGYLIEVAAAVRAAGGLVIADEVQFGIARSGTHFWGFETHGLRPDFVTLGKPVAGGYPLGVVITSREIRDDFGRETSFFSTFGGNPVACAAALAVLDVIEQEGLLENARTTGDYLREGIRALANRHGWIGDVRGSGLLTGVELVRDRVSLEPADSETRRVINLLREDAVLVGRMGPRGNVLKIRPPLVFQRTQADLLIEALDRALGAL